MMGIPFLRRTQGISVRSLTTDYPGAATGQSELDSAVGGDGAGHAGVPGSLLSTAHLHSDPHTLPIYPQTCHETFLNSLKVLEVTSNHTLA